MCFWPLGAVFEGSSEQGARHLTSASAQDSSGSGISLESLEAPANGAVRLQPAVWLCRQVPYGRKSFPPQFTASQHALQTQFGRSFWDIQGFFRIAPMVVHFRSRHHGYHGTASEMLAMFDTHASRQG